MAKKTADVVKKVKKAKSSKKTKDVDLEDLGLDDASSKKKKKAGGFNPYDAYDDILDGISRRLQDADTIDDMKPMSSGSLALDIVLGGGIRPAWLTAFGPEQSAKTTGSLLIMAAAIMSKVPIVALRDFEGSTASSMSYVQSIFRTMGISMTKDQLFGKKDPKTGNWLLKPRVRYSASTRGESFYNWLSQLLRRLPDKKVLGGKWWLVYDDTKENQQKYGQYADKSMAKKYGKGVYLEAPDGGLQGICLVDSYPAMNPTAKDEDEGDNSLALAARMHSKHLPRVKGFLASKKFAVVGINQLRDVPMAMYGPSEQEPGGKALRYNSDVRLRFYPRSMNAAPLWPKPSKKAKAFEAEPGIDGGRDLYRYIHVGAKKNKLSAPERECWLRLWTKDSKGVAHGVDPVFDTIYYLRTTGQLLGKGRHKLQLKLMPTTTESLYKENKKGKKVMIEPKEKSITWDVLKLWVLGTKEDMQKCSKKYTEKPIDLRKYCFKQMENGVSEILFTEIETKSDSLKKGDDDGDDD